jgi:hypothetical protein
VRDKKLHQLGDPLVPFIIHVESTGPAKKQQCAKRKMKHVIFFLPKRSSLIQVMVQLRNMTDKIETPMKVH